MIQVLDRAVAILDYLATNPAQPRPLKEIAAHIGLGPGTCSNILKTMQHHGLVAQSGPRQNYFLGPWLDHISCRTPMRQGLILIAEPEIVCLAEETGETATLSAMYQCRRFVLCKATGNRLLQLRYDFAFSVNPYHSASGRVLLAYLPEKSLNAIVAQAGLPHSHWPEISSLEELHAALAQIRRRGYALRHDQEFENIYDQIHNIAFPVYSGDFVTAAVALMIPGVRFRNAERRRLFEAVGNAAQRISEALSQNGKNTRGCANRGGNGLGTQ